MGKDVYSEAGSYNATSYTINQAGAAVQHLNKTYNELNVVIEKVFKSFDKDNSGFIDLNELAEVSKELGRALDANELAESLRDLDTNKDN